MNILKRSLIYLQRNKKKTLIFLFILTLISMILMVCIAIWQGCHNEVKKLQKQYGKSFVVETLVGEDKIEYFTDEVTGLQMTYYTGPVVDNDLVNQILASDFVEYVCYESIHELVTFPDITFVPGLWANDSIYQSALKPLQTISRITGFIMIFILMMCIVILVLILKIWIKVRQREIGILLSLGETKQKIILQVL